MRCLPLAQRIGGACVAAYNAFQMCADLPRVAFLAMDARHCAGAEMAQLMAYGASVGSNKARESKVSKAVQSSPVRSGPVQSSVVRSKPVQSSPVQSSRVRSDPNPSSPD
eukprot:1235705-Pyramimonas_sp.AAC.1